MSLELCSETPKSPCKVQVANRNGRTDSSNEDFVTLGFKDGLAVIKLQSLPTTDDKDKEPQLKMSTDKKPTPTTTDTTTAAKLVPSSKSPIVVRVDPQTGKKYMHRDGQRYEILGPPHFAGPQALNLTKHKSPERQVNVIVKAPHAQAEKAVVSPIVVKRDNLIVIKPSATSPLRTYGGKRPPPLTPLSPSQVTVPPATLVHASCQTDTADEMFDSSTQTEVPYPTMGDSQFTMSFFNFILSGDEEKEIDCPVSSAPPAVDPVVASKMRSKEELAKFNFFNDMRMALHENSGNLPIHESVTQNNPQAVRKNCIILRARKVSIDIRNHQSYSPLHLAMLCDASMETVNILLKYGAEIDASNFNDGNTALHYAVEHNRLNLLRSLLDHAVRNNISLDLFNFDGLTPLMMCCCANSLELARMFLEMGADPNVRDRKSGRTALFHAAECHAAGIVQLLIEFKADTKLRNFFGTSPHDAMFELDGMPHKIKSLILGREHVKPANKMPPAIRKPTTTSNVEAPPAEATTSRAPKRPNALQHHAQQQFKRIAPHPLGMLPKYRLEVTPTLKKVCASELRTVTVGMPAKKK